MTRRLILAATVVVALTFAAVLAPRAGALTKPQAFAVAKKCLEGHFGTVTRRPDGGGFVVLPHGSAFWTYHVKKGQVRSVTVRFAGSPGLWTGQKVMVRFCVTYRV